LLKRGEKSAERMDTALPAGKATRDRKRRKGEGGGIRKRALQRRGGSTKSSVHGFAYEIRGERKYLDTEKE